MGPATRILVLSNMYPPHHYGGYELSCRDVVDRWRARGHEVTVLTSTMRVPHASDVDEPHVRRELEISYRDGDLYAPPHHRRYGIERRNHRTLRRALDAAQPDVVSIWHMGAMSTSLLRPLVKSRVPLVYVVCDDWPTYAHRIDPWMGFFDRHPRIGRTLRSIGGVPTTLPDVGRSGTFCFISELNRQRCTEHSPWDFPDSTVTYNGIDHRDFPVATEVPRKPWRWRMVTAGRLDPRKGVETAVRALPHLPPEAVLEVLPSVDDPYRERLEKVAADLGVGDRLRFDLIDRAELRARDAAADVYVVPTEWEEPFGLVPLEAMAGGTPVVATGSGGSGEFLIDGRNCLRFPIGDHVAMAAAVRRLADDERLRTRVIEGGFHSATDLNVDRLADVLEDWHLAAARRFADGRPPHRVLA
jgi:glycogen synthase